MARYVPKTIRPDWQEGRTTRLGDRVEFRVMDVFLSSTEEPLVASPGQTRLEGTVIDFSDSGSKVHFFALVEVVTKKKVVVPVEMLALIAPGESGNQQKQ